MTTGTRPTAATAKPVARAERPGTRRAERRQCPVCGERLSAYNPGPACYAHTVGIPWKGPNHKG